MASLISPLDPKSQALVEIVAAGYRVGGGKWPIWQYVDLMLANQGIDAEDAFRGLPTWQLSYRPTWTTGNGVVPIPGDRIALTVHGMYHSRSPYMFDLGNGFVGALRTLAKCRGELQPDPQHPVEFRLESDVLTTKANASAMVNLSTEQLGSVLQREPSTWSGYADGSTGDRSLWRFDVTKQARLAPYADVADNEGYLLVLERLVGYPPETPGAQVYRPPLAVPEALDHLDLTWRLATGLPSILAVSSAGVVAALTQPAHSREEFESRCSSLVDVIKHFVVEPYKPKKHILTTLECRLEEHDGIEMSAARHGLDLLRAILEVRNGLQHTGVYPLGEVAQLQLGLRIWEGDWEKSWNIVRGAAVDGFNGVRVSLRQLIDDRAAGPRTGSIDPSE
ncbi:MAG: hypothetical protein JWM34_488 [Ilumatobacteraceae bacterium]|nr:hypothetical protein [Ilumatobacteraceae bacterium]